MTVLVVFTAKQTGDDLEGYGRMAQRMDELARKMPGFLRIDSARNKDGFGITVSAWESEAHAASWKREAEHLGAQKLGRERWYEHYRVEVAEVTRSYSFKR
ncbi:antibiotic biosynthesis monooxygenase family protein [Parvularcula maris]|uniref:Antibiotic biosynthesis monooxygenase n=1 Tax=Parvularcula maris TaxID=2965077 RepID=A0A9X2RHX1_9PROT|nr:antibiotic biosynthesis monooxygenase [Parvularcula maris]MCQ8185400.1 antibiotic biosynthesis monooxygenase [Parvularcula maris]